MDTSAANTLFATLNRELWLVTAAAEGRRSGLIATSVSRATIVAELPRVLVGIVKHHFTRELIEAAGAFGLHLLGEENLDWVGRFGLKSGRDSDKFAELSVQVAASGSPLLHEAIGWLDCRIEARLDTGDRTVYLAEVLEGHVRRSGPPLTMRRFLELAPPSQIEELKRQTEQDSAIAARAIHAWRQSLVIRRQPTSDHLRTNA